MEDKLNYTCRLVGWWAESGTGELFHFSAPKKAEQLGVEEYAVEVEFTEELNGREFKGVETVFLVETHSDNLGGEVMPL